MGDSIQFTCPQCGAPLEADAEAAGQVQRCPDCGGEAEVPQAPVEVVHVTAVPVDEEHTSARSFEFGTVRSYNLSPAGCQIGCIALLVLMGAGCAGLLGLFS